MRTPLCELALKYDTDKCPGWREGVGHEYTPFYHNYLFRNRQIQNMLEIGICTGASLRMWSDYWPEAYIFGIDNTPEVLFTTPRISTFLCDQGDEQSLKDIKHRCPPLDLIIDDGSHDLNHQVQSALVLYPLLRQGGLYVIEDVQRGTQEQIRRVLPWPSDLHELKIHKRSDNRLIVIEREP